MLRLYDVFLKISKRTGRNPDEKEQMRLTLKVAAIVLTDFVCWFPIILLGILVQAGVLTLPASVFAWCVTFVLPINSAINPYLYTIGGVASRRLKRQHSSAEYGRTRDTLDTEMRVQTLNIRYFVLTRFLSIFFTSEKLLRR